jgi:hypothetical protein
MIYKVEAEDPGDCECEDCRAGRHLYSLFRRRDGQWTLVGFSLQTYTSPEECMKKHEWGVQFEPDAVWEDGSPVVAPESQPSAGRSAETSGPRKMVQLDTGALTKSLASLRKHVIEPTAD